MNDTAEENLETLHSNPSTSNTSVAKFVGSQRYPNVPTLKISDEAHITSVQPLSSLPVPDMVTEFMSYHLVDKMDMDIVTDKKPGVQGGMSRGYKKFQSQSYMNDSRRAAMLSSDTAIANADLDSPTKLNCRSAHNIKRNQSSTVASEKNSKSKYWSGDRYARRKPIKKGLNRNAPANIDFAKNANNDSRSYELSNYSCPNENQNYNSIGVVPKRHETTKVEEEQNEVQDFIEAKAPVPIYGRPVDCEQLSAKLRELLFRLSEAEDQSDSEPKLLSPDSGIDLLATDETAIAKQGEVIPPNNMSVTPFKKSRPSVLMSWTVERYKWLRKQIDNDDRFLWERFDYTKDYKVDVVDEILRSRTRSAPPVDYHYYQTMEWMRSYFHEEVTGERGLGA
ncbi:hypothetical protein BKA69DRAFT_727576 [Paraphysoderma sedebokerense]|nr:hypothetical protein BKA69DRAFT_727576 [Paraphysoderma sedebokerense]